MHELLSGTKPLRGRAMMDMRLPALDFREAAQLWRIQDAAVALRVHAVVGGIPGYRALVPTTPQIIREFDDWVVQKPPHRRRGYVHLYRGRLPAAG